MQPIVPTSIAPSSEYCNLSRIVRSHIDTPAWPLRSHENLKIADEIAEDVGRADKPLPPRAGEPTARERRAGPRWEAVAAAVVR